MTTNMYSLKWTLNKAQVSLTVTATRITLGTQCCGVCHEERGVSDKLTYEVCNKDIKEYIPTCGGNPRFSGAHLEWLCSQSTLLLSALVHSAPPSERSVALSLVSQLMGAEDWVRALKDHDIVHAARLGRRDWTSLVRSLAEGIDHE